MNNNKSVKCDIYDVLLDENNTAPVYLTANDGKEVGFDQIAVIPYEGQLYAILKPLTPLPEVKDDEAMVFLLGQNEDAEGYLKVEDDMQKAKEIFKQYYTLVLQSTDDEEIINAIMQKIQELY